MSLISGSDIRAAHNSDLQSWRLHRLNPQPSFILLSLPATPLVSWPHSTAGSGMRLVQWSEHRPGLFLAQDCHSTVYIWSVAMGYMVSPWATIRL